MGGSLVRSRGPGHPWEKLQTSLEGTGAVEPGGAGDDNEMEGQGRSGSVTSHFVTLLKWLQNHEPRLFL